MNQTARTSGTITIMNLRNARPAHEYDVRVDRSSVLGNPFNMEHDESLRDSVCDKYEEYFYKQIRRSASFIQEIDRIRQLYMKHGRIRLYCWCHPKRCHAETIAKYIGQSVSAVGTL
jgi:hypothetical protein